MKIFLTYSDAVFANNENTRYNFNGYTIKLFSGIIHFKAIKQKIITIISTEAEISALTLIAKVYI